MDAETKKYVEWIKANLDKPAGKTQSALARHLNLAHPQITRLLKGKRRLKIDEIPKIAAFLGVPPPVSTEDEMFADIRQLYDQANEDARRLALEILKVGRRRPEPPERTNEHTVPPRTTQK